jgi:hypothetical protein
MPIPGLSDNYNTKGLRNGAENSDQAANYYDSDESCTRKFNHELYYTEGFPSHVSAHSCFVLYYVYSSQLRASRFLLKISKQASVQGTYETNKLYYVFGLVRVLILYNIQCTP